MKSKFKNVDELYAGIDKLVDMLRAEQQEEIALGINKMVNETAWTTGSELLGELLLYLNNIAVPLSSEANSHLADCKYFCKNYRRTVRIQH